MEGRTVGTLSYTESAGAADVGHNAGGVEEGGDLSIVDQVVLDRKQHREPGKALTFLE